MAYSIRYGKAQDLKRYEKGNDPNWGLSLLAFLMALAAGIRVFMPEVFDSVVTAFIPWDETAVSAFQLMVENVYQGQPVGEAVDAFCRSIIENAEFWS